MSLKARLRGLERAARGRLAWIDLPGGESFFYDPSKTAAALFLYATAGYRAGRDGQPLPEAPEVLRVIASLRDRAARSRALNAVYGASENPFVCYDMNRFLDTGEIVMDSRIRRKAPDDELPDEGAHVVRIGNPPDHLR